MEQVYSDEGDLEKLENYIRSEKLKRIFLNNSGVQAIELYASRIPSLTLCKYYALFSEEEFKNRIFVIGEEGSIGGLVKKLDLKFGEAVKEEI